MKQKHLFVIIGIFICIFALMTISKTYKVYQIQNGQTQTTEEDVPEIKTEKPDDVSDKRYKQEGNIEAGIVTEIFTKRSGNGYNLNCITLEGCPLIFKTPDPVTIKKGYAATIKFYAPDADRYALIEEIL